MRIALVDGSAASRGLLRTLLQRLGHADIVEMRTGSEALTRLEQAPFDLVFVDESLPEMDGLTCVRRIRALGGSPRLVLCLAEATKSVVVEAVRAGANHYLVKPVTMEALTDRLGRLAWPACAPLPATAGLRAVAQPS